MKNDIIEKLEKIFINCFDGDESYGTFENFSKRISKMNINELKKLLDDFQNH